MQASAITGYATFRELAGKHDIGRWWRQKRYISGRCMGKRNNRAYSFTLAKLLTALQVEMIGSQDFIALMKHLA